MAFGFLEILPQYHRPLIWAILCSIPLRNIQLTLESFWSHSIQLGLTQSLLAVPVSLFTLFHPQNHSCGKLRFLVSLGLFIFAYEELGGFGALFLLGVAFLFSSKNLNTLSSFTSNFRRNAISDFFTREILKRLRIIVAAGLIVTMVFGFLTAVVFFTYKIGVEGKDALIYLKMHVEEYNCVGENDGVGMVDCVGENDGVGMVESYVAKLYKAASDHIDDLAVEYNMTLFVTGIKHFVISKSSAPLRALTTRFRNCEWSQVYAELDSLFGELDFLGKAKQFGIINGIDVSQCGLANSIKLVLFIANSIVSGAAELSDYVSQSMVFIWVLYYLMISDSGVVEQVMYMLPISNPTRVRCVQDLDKAISQVFLATAETAIFQGGLTWILFRMYKIHFLYMSTLIAIINPLLPIFPSWLATIPAAIQLLLQGRYIGAVVCPFIHLFLMDYGASDILKNAPTLSTYLNWLSIFGGVTLFQSALEGAFMGRLIIAIVIVMKDLCTEERT